VSAPHPPATAAAPWQAAADHPHGGGAHPLALRATLALARVEGLRLLRHPLVLLATVLIVWVWVAEQVRGDRVGRYPTLHRADADTQAMLLFLAGAALVAANLAVLRARRHGVEAWYGTLALPVWRRGLAHLLSVLPVALVGGLLAGAHLAQLAMLPGAVGRPNPVELATGPVLVALGGAVGVLLARLVRSPLAAPLALLLLAWLLYGVDSLGYAAGDAARHFWLSVYVPQTWSWWSPVPADLLGRPAGWHLVYLAGIVLLVAVAALARAGGPRRRLAAVAAAALAVVVLAGSAQLRPPAGLQARREAAVERPASVQVCQQRGSVRYCFFPDFARRVGVWDRIVQAILRRLPARATPVLVVRQQVDPSAVLTDGGRWDALLRTRQEANRRAGTASALTVGTSWEADLELELATAVAFRAIGSPIWKDPEAAKEQATLPSTEVLVGACGAPSVVALWLTAQVSPAITQKVRAAQASASAARQELLASLAPGETIPGEGQPGDGVTLHANAGLGGPNIDFGPYEAAVAVALLDRPPDQVEQVLRRHWQELSSSATSSARAAELFAVRPPTRDPSAQARPRSC
jgi:hypothetical protein